MLISGANEPLQRWEMCVETLQRFMGFALAALQHQAMNEADINAATNVVSVIHSVQYCILDETHHCHHHH